MKIPYDDDEEESRLHRNVKILDSGWAKFKPTKQPAPGQTSNELVVARLLLLKWNDNRPGERRLPKVFAIGYEVDTVNSNDTIPGDIPDVAFDDGDGTDPVRIVHLGVDYSVRLCLTIP